MTEAADIVVIGAGIVGCSVGYHLALAGSAKVVIIEKELICSGSTGKSAGGIRQQFATELNIRLSTESMTMFRRMPEELGVDPGFHQIGYLFLASTAQELAMFERNVELQKRLAVPAEMLGLDDIRKLIPFVQLDDIRGGSYCPTDGYAAPYEVTMGYAAAARRRGVKIHEQRPVTGILTEEGKIRGVLTEQGAIHAPIVVNAAGPHAEVVGRLAGVDVPVKPYRRQVFTTLPLPAFPPEPPLTIDYHRNWYFRGELGGCLFSGPKDEESTFNTNVDWEHVAESVTKAVARIPILEDAEIHRGWAGLYEISPDNNALLGPISGLDGFYVAAGFSGHGFMHGPVSGKLLAQLITTGQTEIDIRALAPDRFTAGRAILEPMTMHQA